MDKPYDDEDELATYVWSFYGRFLTPVESRAFPAVFALAKARVGHTRFADGLLRCKALTEDPDVVAVLADGAEAFRRRTANRIVRDHADEVFVNRCGRCTRIVRTPRAQQCLWCGFDWHKAATPEPAA